MHSDKSKESYSGVSNRNMKFITKKGLVEANMTATGLHIAKVNLKDFMDKKIDKKWVAKPKGKIKFI